ncbi:MAG: M67 family metallopeptidase [Acidobacteriota bacterium]
MSDLLVHITDQVKREIETHALEAQPSECCGLLSGGNGVITDLHPLPNEADRPEVRFFATPEGLFAAMRRIREANQSLLGIYHSHPRTAAYPSASDVEMAFYPEAVYFIISLEHSAELRAFKIEGSKIDNVEIILT